MRWFKPSEGLPKQGVRVLCVSKGDVWVAQRMGKYWFPIPFCDSIYATCTEPDLWCFIDLPNGLTGGMKVAVDNGKLIDMDAFEKQHPEEFNDFVETLKKGMRNP
jgi:hypothetical protein